LNLQSLESSKKKDWLLTFSLKQAPQTWLKEPRKNASRRSREASKVISFNSEQICSIELADTCGFKRVTACLNTCGSNLAFLGDNYFTQLNFWPLSFRGASIKYDKIQNQNHFCHSKEKVSLVISRGSLLWCWDPEIRKQICWTFQIINQPQSFWIMQIHAAVASRTQTIVIVIVE